MSMDFRKTTYRPNRPHTRLRTSYGTMSKWMTLSEGTNLAKRPDVPTSLYIQDPVHAQYDHQAGYDDFHKAYRHYENSAPSLMFPAFGPPRLRYGRAGGSWRHVKEVMQAKGRRTLFVDGQIRNEDNDRLDEVPGGHMLQPSARPGLSRGQNCPVMGRERVAEDYPYNTTHEAYQQDPIYGHSVGAGDPYNVWMDPR